MVQGKAYFRLHAVCQLVSWVNHEIPDASSANPSGGLVEEFATGLRTPLSLFSDVRLDLGFIVF